MADPENVVPIGKYPGGPTVSRYPSPRDNDPRELDRSELLLSQPWTSVGHGVIAEHPGIAGGIVCVATHPALADAIVAAHNEGLIPYRV